MIEVTDGVPAFRDLRLQDLVNGCAVSLQGNMLAES